MCWVLYEVGWCLGIALYLQASCDSNSGVDIAAGKETPRAGCFKLDGSSDLSRGTTEPLQSQRWEWLYHSVTKTYLPCAWGSCAKGS